MRVVEELSRADASVGWITLIGGGTWLDLAGLPRATFDAMYRPGDDTIVAGVFNPTGVAVPVDGGYRVNGRWSFASGCEHADWLYGNCVDTSSGEPQLRIAVFRPDEVEIEDTWSVSASAAPGATTSRSTTSSSPRSARSTCSPTRRASTRRWCEHPVPASLALLAGRPCRSASPRARSTTCVDLATEKVPAAVAGDAGRQPAVPVPARRGRRAAPRGAVRSSTRRPPRPGRPPSRGDEFTPQLRARLRSAAVHAATTAAAVVETAYRAGGGSSLYATSPLQRRLRDVNAVSQHFLLKPDTLTTCGAVLAGQEPRPHHLLNEERTP